MSEMPSRRRVVVALDASPASLDALRAAADLASRLEAELAGLFVEDEDVLRLSDLPFGGIVRSPEGRAERLERRAVEASLRAMAARARDALRAAAAAAHVAASFEIARGRVVSRVLAAAEDADLLALGASGHGRRARGAFGGTARAAAAGAAGPVLLIPRGARVGSRIFAVDDGSPAAARASGLARALAGSNPPRVLRAEGAALASVADRIGPHTPALVVLPASGPPTRSGILERLLALGIPVLLVR